MQVKLLVEGGNMQPGPALSQKIGPMGLNVGQIIQKVNDATKDFKGMKVPVELEIDPSTKEVEVKVSSPPASELIKKELGIEKGSAQQKKVKAANASIEQIISVAKTKLPNMLSKDLKAAVKTIVGSCVSLGILVESKSPQEVEKEIDSGKYDKEINGVMTETPEDKKKELEEYFSKIKEEQEKIIEQEEAAKAAEEAEKPKEEEANTEEKTEKKEEKK